MLFNSLNYFVFLPVVFIIYWGSAKNLKLQNIILLTASYIFYGCWSWHFLFLLIFSTLLDFYTGLKIAQTDKPVARKIWFGLSVGLNLSFLCVFKYYNFFVENIVQSSSFLGFKINPWLLSTAIPVGISFYTFHGLSYVTDVYKKQIKPEKSLVNYSLFVSFFPLLVAGPIERATHLLPQIKNRRTFDSNNAADGLRQMLWGLFKKVVIADQCAAYVNPVFENPQNYSGSDLSLAAILFAIQIYGDFSGYSDIALGSARLLGINLLQNFSYPYFSRSVAEFWRRWHISLSSWFRDYVYIPLGGSKKFQIRNLFVIFILSGFWHGANWTFLIWGVLNALFMLPSILFGTNRHHIDIVAKGKILPTFKEFFQISLTFASVVFLWIFFRSDSISKALVYISGILSTSSFTIPSLRPRELSLFIGLFIILEWIGREETYAIKKLGLKWPRLIRWSAYYLIIFFILYQSSPKQEFIYFQF